jgi:alpha/beta superfamily hydrolase
MRRAMIDGPIGLLEVVLNVPEAPPAGIALIAHPHSQQGGTLDAGRADAGQDVFRDGLRRRALQFPRVGASGGTFDEGIGNRRRARRACLCAGDRLGNALPIVLAGFSVRLHVQTRVANGLSAAAGAGRSCGSPLRRGVRSRRYHRHSRRRGRRGAASRRVRVGAAVQGLPVVVFPDAWHFFMAACRNCSA